jgi:hypothetical protein
MLLIRSRLRGYFTVVLGRVSARRVLLVCTGVWVIQLSLAILLIGSGLHGKFSVVLGRVSTRRVLLV